MIDFAAKLTRVVHHSEPHDVDIRRPGMWGNPFVIGKHGTRKDVCRSYQMWIPNQPQLLARVHELKGKRLGCACRDHERPCHGETLVILANADPEMVEIMYGTCGQSAWDELFSNKDLTEKRKSFTSVPHTGPVRAKHEPHTMNPKTIFSIIATIAAGIACACRKAAGEDPEDDTPITTRTVVEGTPGGKPGKKKPAPEPEEEEITVEIDDDDEPPAKKGGKKPTPAADDDDEPVVPAKGKKTDLNAEIKKAIQKLFDIDEEIYTPKVVKIFKAFSIKSISDAEPDDLPAILAAIKKIPVPTSDD